MWIKTLTCCILFISLYINQCQAEFECPNQCTCSEKSIHCSRVKFDKFPNLNFKTVTYLTITGSKIRELKNGTLKNFKDLKYLDLSNNRIVKIESHALNGPINLVKLNLANNYLHYIPDSAFNELSRTLKKINLANNAIKTLPTSIEKMVKAKIIDLSNNPIHCDCQLKYFVNQLIKSRRSIRYPKCKTPANLKDKTINNLNFVELCQDSTDNATVPPVLINDLKDIQTSLGDRIMFNCETHDVRNDKVKWILPFKDMNYLSYFLRNHILVIEEVHDIHEGVIQCEVTNRKGRVVSTANLKIVPGQKPYVVEGPTSVTVKKGSTVTFRCRAEGHPTPIIDWLWIKTSSIRLETSDKFIVRPNELIIKNVDAAESVGRFVCYASNLSGSTKVSAVITVVNEENNSKKPSKTNLKITSSKKIRNEQIVAIIEEARKKINKEFKRTSDRLKNPNNSRDRNRVASLFRQPNQAALELARATEIYESALDKVVGILRDNDIKLNLTDSKQTNVDLTNLLTPEQIAIISQLSGCQSSSDELYCAQQLCFHKNYRSIDGKCNNLVNARKGAALSPFHRLMTPEYENGINTPIGWSAEKLYNGYPKPSARLVSSQLLRANKISPDPKHSVMIMQWGQFLDHDMDFTPVDAGTSRFSDGLGCNETCVNDSPCFPILTPPGDLRIKRPCIGFSRSIATCGSGQSSIILGQLHYREQVNQITSFIDASNVYGSEDLEATEIRDLTYDEGKLREGTITEHKKRLLPFNVRGQIDCQIDPAKSHVPCFKAGDHRNNENLGLLSMHTIWMREHNRLADELRKLNSFWSGDKVYFEARKIVGAAMQQITYTQWLPEVLGPEGMKMLGEFKGYNDSVDATISNVFSTAAMRFGHSLINPILYRLDENFKPIPQGNLPLHKAFFAPDMILQDGGIDPILRGLYGKSSKAVKSEEPMNTEIIEKLFAMAHEVALDLGALNIQRGRDHGLPSYNSWRKFCNLKPAKEFNDFFNEIPSKEILEKMRQIYGNPENVDLFAGGLLEKKVANGLVGPTFRCLLVDQFRRTRDGDRFWYENNDQFSASQLSQIRQVSLSRIICDNGDNISKVQRNVFLTPTKSNPLMDCSKIKYLQLLPWKECVSRDNFNSENLLNETPLRRSRRGVEGLNCPAKLEKLEERVQRLEKSARNL